MSRLPGRTPRLGRVDSVGGALRYRRWGPCSPASGFPDGRVAAAGACTPQEDRDPFVQLSGTRSATHHANQAGEGSRPCISSSDVEYGDPAAAKSTLAICARTTPFVE